jgi:hypothetical protein
MHKLPIRFVDNTWEVRVPHGDIEKWVCCRTESDARQMAGSGNLVFAVDERHCKTEHAALELDECAALFDRYGCEERALWLKEYAKLARNQPSCFTDLCPLA